MSADRMNVRSAFGPFIPSAIGAGAMAARGRRAPVACRYKVRSRYNFRHSHSYWRKHEEPHELNICDHAQARNRCHNGRHTGITANVNAAVINVIIREDRQHARCNDHHRKGLIKARRQSQARHSPNICARERFQTVSEGKGRKADTSIGSPVVHTSAARSTAVAVSNLAIMFVLIPCSRLSARTQDCTQQIFQHSVAVLSC